MQNSNIKNMKSPNFNAIDPDKISKKITKILSIIIIIFLALSLFIVVIFSNLITPVDEDDSNVVQFVIQDGWGINRVCDELEKDNLIKNSSVAKIIIKFSQKDTNIEKGTYELSKNMSTEEILDKIISADSLENETVPVTLIEGKRFTSYIKTISDALNLDYDELINLSKDSTFLQSLIDKYWFITDDILDSDIYYPLEGYIFPDTYNFKKSSTGEEVYIKMLDEMNDKLSPYRETIENSGRSVHGLLTLGSVVELEAVTAEDRKTLAGLFINRINLGMTLGSDVTTYYAVNKEIGDDLTVSDLNSCNRYNTRGNCATGLPVGPICSPSLTSIVAAINPDTTTPYLYFVADKNGKLYFAKTLSEHNDNISYLKSHDLWLN